MAIDIMQAWADNIHRLTVECAAISMELSTLRGETWQAELLFDDSDAYMHQYNRRIVRQSDHLSFLVQVNEYKNRLEFSPCFHPKHGERNVLYDCRPRYAKDLNYAVNISRNKPAKQIAKEIDRRIMKEWIELHSATMERYKEHMQREFEMDVLFHRLAAAAGVEILDHQRRRRQFTATCNTYRAEVTVNSQHGARLVLDVDALTAERIITDLRRNSK